MTIPKKVLEEWNELYDHGDYKTIAEENDIDVQSVSGAFKKGKTSIEIFQILKTFYAKRKKQITA